MGQTRANITVSVLYQITAAVCSLVLPRYILRYFGSDVNGMLQTIGQLLSYTVLMESGVGGLIMASFYKPLAEHDNEAVSDIFHNAKMFFDRISYVYFGLVAVLCVTAKLFIRTSFDFWYVSGMVLILAFNYYFNYYFAMAHRILLRADQKIRVIQSVQIVTMLVNLAVCIIAVKLSCGIHTVKLISTLIYLSNPFIFRFYVKRHYSLNKTVYDKNRAMPKKSSGLVHHIAYFIHMNTDIVLLSIFSDTKEVSVYSVYNSVVFTIEAFFSAISDAMSGTIGKLLASGQTKKLSDTYSLYNTANLCAATFFCVAEAVLIVPFVGVYTKDVSDVNYLRPVFSAVLIAAQWFYCVRIPANCVIYAAGHYEQTKKGAYAEVILNLGISLLTVRRFGMVGVAVGTAVAMAVRSVYIAWYLSKNILCRPFYLYCKETVLYGVIGVGIWFAVKRLVFAEVQNLGQWLVLAVVVSVAVLIALSLCVLPIEGRKLMSLIKASKNDETVN